MPLVEHAHGNTEGCFPECPGWPKSPISMEELTAGVEVVHNHEGGAPACNESCPAWFPEMKIGQTTRELWDWWIEQAKDEAEGVLPKAIEYGSNSLIQVGRKMAQLQGRTVGDEEATELGCWVYTVSKVERWTDAVMRGERPGDDTLYDARVYLGMARRNREVGGWPTGPKEEGK